MYPNVNAPFAMGANVNAPFTMGAAENMPFTMGEASPYQPYHYSPVMGYSAPSRCYDSFILIVVLFILLIIVGAGSYSKC
ncbi:YjcZ family sporulation protein [Halalkalibacter kiskunsagensis]|uniref:YjcZ family sporulation protein n=1 Tax=Halalkalibacter kiskunsagensis TaxID=1548599 RepID=A0ABV6KA48_9BACI